MTSSWAVTVADAPVAQLSVVSRRLPGSTVHSVLVTVSPTVTAAVGCMVSAIVKVPCPLGSLTVKLNGWTSTTSDAAPTL